MSGMPCALEVRGLCVRYGAQAVLRNVDLELRHGEWMGLIGPNGSGKTSLIRALVGLLPVHAGTIHVAGIDLTCDPVRARQCLGYAPDPSLLPVDLTGRQVLGVVAEARGCQGIPEDIALLCQRLGMSRWLDAMVGTYSLGTRQKLAVLIALLGHPPLLVLDEVLNGLDPIACYELKSELGARCARKECAVLLATHGLEAAPSFLSGAVLLSEGTISHRWGEQELLAWRDADPRAFEHAVVEALRRDVPGAGIG